MQHDPAISVLMPIYNGMPLLREAVKCLAEQGMADGEWEIIAADDGSTDGSREFLETIANDGKLPLRVINGSRSGNWVASTNLMIKQSRGVFISFLHQDDLYAPGRLRKMLDAARANPDSPFLANDTFFVSTDGCKRGSWRPPLSRGRVEPLTFLETMLVQNNLSVPAVFFRRDLVDSLGFMDESLKYTADWDYWLRLASVHGVYHVAEELSGFRINPGSQTVSIAARQDEMRFNLQLVVDRFMPAAERMIHAPAVLRRCRRLAALGVETDLVLAAKAAGVRAPWRKFFGRLIGCSPMDLACFISRSRIFQRVLPRLARIPRH